MNTDDVRRIQLRQELKEALPDDRFVEHPELAAGTRLECRKCGSNAILYPTRSVDPRWMFGVCVACRKRQIVDVFVGRT